jgi:two-component system, OmpR family, sensor histidine kinase CreC
MFKRLSLTARIFLVYALFVALAGWFVMRTVLEEIKPAVRQSTEETLVDTANLLAEMVSGDLRNGTLSQSNLALLLTEYGKRLPHATIWGVEKNAVNHRIYITDAKGTVLFDSTGKALGQDYSRWNDVYLTLRGHYGARTTQDIPGDETSTVMHVAAPVRDGTNIIGVVTIAKPNRTLQPYIDRARRRLWLFGSGVILAGLAIGALLSWWLSAAIRRLTHFADAVSAGDRVSIPQLPGGELGQLARSLESMRTQLEGKAYVERYVQTLTHELKGPLSGIHGAAELLRGDLVASEKHRFLDNIDVETSRLQQMSERLLNLASVEQRHALEEQVDIPLRSLVDEVVTSVNGRSRVANISIENLADDRAVAKGERFLVRQAIANLVDNAVDFTPAGGRIRIAAASVAATSSAGGLVIVTVKNEGEPIPEFALGRLTERFYSLPRPATGRKSTGLGLSFVQEVAQLHGGHLSVRNEADGVVAELTLPGA